MITPLAQTLLATLFVSAPLSVVPLLDQSTRMDLLDLYEAGMKAQGGNRYGGVSELTALSDSFLCVRLTDVSSLEMHLLDDSIVEMKHRVKVPEREFTTTRLYNADWQAQ